MGAFAVDLVTLVGLRVPEANPITARVMDHGIPVLALFFLANGVVWGNVGRRHRLLGYAVLAAEVFAIVTNVSGITPFVAVHGPIGLGTP